MARVRFGEIPARIPEALAIRLRDHLALRHRVEGFLIGANDLERADKQLARDLLALDATPEEAVCAIRSARRSFGPRARSLERAMRIVEQVVLEARP